MAQKAKSWFWELSFIDFSNGISDFRSDYLISSILPFSRNYCGAFLPRLNYLYFLHFFTSGSSFSDSLQSASYTISPFPPSFCIFLMSYRCTNSCCSRSLWYQHETVLLSDILQVLGSARLSKNPLGLLWFICNSRLQIFQDQRDQGMGRHCDFSWVDSEFWRIDVNRHLE